MTVVSQRWARVLDWAWLLAWGVASSVWCVTASARLGATFDEPVYLERGLEGWRTGSHYGLIRLGTMPLPIDVQTFPLYLYEKATGTRLDPAADCDVLLPWARAGTLVFWWLLLSYGRLTGRSLAGPWGGRAAVAVLACEPNLLAHAALATTDVAVSACVLALLYHFRTARDAGWGRRVALPAAWYGAALLAKASALAFGPLVLLAAEAGRVLHEKRARGERLRPLRPAFAPFLRDGAQVLALGLILAFVVCGSDWRAEPSFVKWAESLPEGPARSGTVWLAENLRVFSNAGDGIVRQVRHNIRGHGVFLLGEVHPRALWYYFPVALAIKLPLPLLLLPLVVVVARPAALANWACLGAGILLLFSLNCRVQIGIRLVLPLVALGAAGLAAAAVNAGRGRLRWLPLGGLALGVLWTVGEAVAVWPHGLCYANELWGGTENAYLRLSDSNFDWGQGLKELERWREKRNLAELDVWYFGTDPAVRSPRLHLVPFHTLDVSAAADVHGQVRGRYLAASATLVYGIPSNTPGHLQAAAFLRRHQPVARVATFLVYDFGEPNDRAAAVRGRAYPAP